MESRVPDTEKAASVDPLAATPWPWRTGNRFELLSETDAYFGRMLETIESSRAYILLEMYLVESGIVAGRFVDALTRAAARGVHVFFMIDAFGSLAFAHSDRRRLEQAGVELRLFNALSWDNKLRNLLRDHRKLLLVDGILAMVGGVGITDEFGIGGARGGPWRDLMAEIHGPVVVDWHRAFARTWRRFGPELPLADPAVGPELEDGATGRVALSEARQRSWLANDVVRRIDNATSRAWIMSAYFVPSRRFRKALRRAARRHVDVRLVVPGPLTDHPWVRQAARRFYGKMLRSGVKIFEYQPRMLHAKMTVCDDWVSIGSSNLDRWSFRWNLEANQEISDARFAAAAAAVFEGDCRQSQEITSRYWRQRAWLDRVQERIAGVLDRMLDRWRRPKLP